MLCMPCTQMEALSGVPSTCPFCKSEFTVAFRGPLTPAQRRCLHKEEQLIIEAQLQARTVRAPFPAHPGTPCCWPTVLWLHAAYMVMSPVGVSLTCMPSTGHLPGMAPP